MTSGRVVAADRRPVEANLTADVLAADTVLPVTDASIFAEEDDFAEGPQWVVIGKGLTPVEYVATDTESSPLRRSPWPPRSATDSEAGLPVTMWDPSVQIDDKRSVEIVVKVALDEHPGEVPITASVDHAMVPLSGIDSLVGAQVTLADDDFDQWRVANVPGRASVVDSGYVQTPTVRARLVTSTPLAAGVWDTVMLTSSEKQDFDYDPGTGVFTARRDGVYVAHLPRLVRAQRQQRPRAACPRLLPRRHQRGAAVRPGRCGGLGDRVAGDLRAAAPGRRGCQLRGPPDVGGDPEPAGHRRGPHHLRRAGPATHRGHDLPERDVRVNVPPDAALRDARTDVSDLTASVLDGDPYWEAPTTLVLPFDPEPSVAEQALIRRRLMTRDADEEAWVTALVAARAADDVPAMTRLLADRALVGIDAPQEA